MAVSRESVRFGIVSRNSLLDGDNGLLSYPTREVCFLRKFAFVLFLLERGDPFIEIVQLLLDPRLLFIGTAGVSAGAWNSVIYTVNHAFLLFSVIMRIHSRSGLMAVNLL